MSLTILALSIAPSFGDNYALPALISSQSVSLSIYFRHWTPHLKVCASWYPTGWSFGRRSRGGAWQTWWWSSRCSGAATWTQTAFRSCKDADTNRGEIKWGEHANTTRTNAYSTSLNSHLEAHQHRTTENTVPIRSWKYNKMQSWPLELEAINWKESWDIWCVFTSVVVLTRKRGAGCWLWAAQGTPWWRSPRWSHSSESPGTGERTAGPHQTPWGMTPARTSMSARNPPHVHPSWVAIVTDICCLSFPLEGSRAGSREVKRKC